MPRRRGEAVPGAWSLHFGLQNWSFRLKADPDLLVLRSIALRDTGLSGFCISVFRNDFFERRIGLGLPMNKDYGKLALHDLIDSAEYP